MKHPIIAYGIVKTLESDQPTKVYDRGYSFCNCKNIFYTDWENIDQRVYDKAYFEKYNGEGTTNLYRQYAKEYFPLIKQYKEVHHFIDIGSSSNAMLDEAIKEGWSASRLDINDNSKDNGYNIIIGDIEKVPLSPYDCIWMSHIVEHLHYPLKAMKNVYDSLTNGGVLFVAMPDPYFIQWQNPLLWGHWALREHHILWDMDSFIKEMEAIGFKTILSKRNILTKTFICCMDFHVLFQKEAK